MFIVSAPSGAGKTTLCKEVLNVMATIRHSVSFTTRKPRKGEINNVDYTFITDTEFQKMVKKGEFLEWAEVHGNLYGTSRKRLEAALKSGFHVLLDVDTQGAEQIRRKRTDGIYIFILPPSMETLRKRLEKRKSNTQKDIQRRLRRATEEIRDFNKYDYVIVNDTLKDSLKKLEAIIISEGIKTRNVDSSIIKTILK